MGWFKDGVPHGMGYYLMANGKNRYGMILDGKFVDDKKLFANDDPQITETFDHKNYILTD